MSTKIAQWFSPEPQGAVSAWWAGQPEVAEALFNRAYTDFSGLEICLSLERIDPNWQIKNQTDFTIFQFNE